MTTASPGEQPEGGLPHLEAANRAFIERQQDHDEGRGDIPADTFSNRLILARVHAGWLTVKDAAERCGLNYGSWSNWERGARPRDLLDVVQAVAKGLRIDHEWLLFGGPLLPARGRPAKRPMEVNEDYRHLIRRTSRTADQLLAPHTIVRVDPQTPIKTCVAGRRANRVNPVRPDEAIYTG